MADVQSPMSAYKSFAMQLPLSKIANNSHAAVEHFQLHPETVQPDLLAIDVYGIIARLCHEIETLRQRVAFLEPATGTDHEFEQ